MIYIDCFGGRLEDNIKMDITLTDRMDWDYLAEDRDQWRTIVDNVAKGTVSFHKSRRLHFNVLQ
jgi:hypothetical protein